AADNALILSVVTHVDRFVSIGQLPSGRTDCTRNSTHLRTTGWSARPALARPSATKLVSGAASRKPPLLGWTASRTRKLVLLAKRRRIRWNGSHGRRWWYTA